MPTEPISTRRSEHPEDRGLAGPVRAEQRHHRADRNGQVEAVDSGNIAVPLGELASLDGETAGHPRDLGLRVLPGRSVPSSARSFRSAGRPWLSIFVRTRPSSFDMNSPPTPVKPVCS